MTDESTADQPRRRARRGSAAAELTAAASRLLADATLDDLTAFVTVGRLTEASGLSNGAIYSSFCSTDERSAPQAAARDAFLSVGPDDDEMVLQIIELVHASLEAEDGHDERFLETLAELAAAPVVESARGGALTDYTHMWFAAAIARNDPAAKAVGRALFTAGTKAYERIVTRVLELSDRVLAEGVDLTALVSVLMAGGDGLAMRLRLDDDADPDLVRVAFLSAFASMTRRRDDVDDPFVGRVVAPASIRFDDELRSTVHEAVTTLVERAGWSAVTLGRVAGMTHIAETTLVAVYPTRHHLAALVWADVLAMVERRARSRRSLASEVQVDELVADLAEAACARRSLVTSLLTARLQGPSAGDDPADDPSERLIDMFAEVLDGGSSSSTVAARTAVDALLMGAAASDSDAAALAGVLVAGLRSIRTARQDP